MLLLVGGWLSVPLRWIKSMFSACVASGRQTARHIGSIRWAFLAI